MTIRIMIGDARHELTKLADQSVHCCVTSPPYFGLRDYGVAGQIGLEPTPDAFVAEMVAVFREVRRVLRDDGVLFLNLGDSYWASGQRQTGRNDVDRETPGGRGGSFRGGIRRAIACGNGDKEPEDSPSRDCFCQNLCGACRAAYQIGKSHSGPRPGPTPPSSSSASNREHTELQFVHAPMSDSIHQGGHNLTATRDLALSQDHEGEQPPASLVSMFVESSLQHPAASPRSGQPSECQLCGCSLPDCAQPSARNSACTCDTDPQLDASNQDKSGKFSSRSAYPSYTTASLKPKDLIGIPWRVAFALRADGWYLRQDIIWSKPNPMPESVTDRCTKAHEYIFLLSKSARYFYDADEIKEDGALRQSGQTQNKYVGDDPLHRTKAGLLKIRANVYEKVNKRSVWEIATQPFSDAHFATFPPALIEPCIKAGCPVGGTVLDPFGGAGTTGLVADRLQRSSILIELNPEYEAMAERRIRDDAPLFVEAAE